MRYRRLQRRRGDPPAELPREPVSEEVSKEVRKEVSKEESKETQKNKETYISAEPVTPTSCAPRKLLKDQQVKRDCLGNQQQGSLSTPCLRAARLLAQHKFTAYKHRAVERREDLRT